jgi:hypothetical protein
VKLMLASERLPWSRAILAIATAAALTGVGCKRGQEIDGVADYSLARTVLAHAPGVCSPDGELTWCHSNPGIAFGSQRASVDLYFRGDHDDAPLVEILLAMNRCRPAEVEGILSHQLGDPDLRRGSLLRWNGAYAVIFAQLAAEGGGCQVHFVSPDDEARISALGDREAAPAPDEPTPEDTP